MWVSAGIRSDQVLFELRSQDADPILTDLQAIQRRYMCARSGEAFDHSG